MKALLPLLVVSVLCLGACASGPVKVGHVTKENYYHRRPGMPGGHFHQEKTLASYRLADGETAAVEDPG